MTSRTLSVLLLALACATGARAASEQDMAPAGKAAADLYWQGQGALRESDWDGALARFRDLEQRMRKDEPDHVDTALYWEAYALAKARRSSEARAAVARLRKDFPQSRWLRDADALVTAGSVATTAAATGDALDDDLADVALQGLLSAPPARALPLLRKVLAGSRPLKVKKRALFVLSQIDDPAALDLVVDTARTASDPSLREEAIRMLGIGGQPAAIERLRAIYQAGDAGVRGEVIQAWLVAGRADLVLGAARDEADAEVRGRAIHALGAMGAASELAQLLASTREAENRRAIIRALGVAGDAGALKAIASDASNAEDERVEAIRALGIAGDHGGSDALAGLYASAQTPALRDAALQGLLVAGDEQTVLRLYRAARDPAEKKTLLRTLSIMGGDAALDAIEHELGGDEGGRK
jgi:hypothetical protein